MLIRLFGVSVWVYVLVTLALIDLLLVTGDGLIDTRIRIRLYYMAMCSSPKGFRLKVVESCYFPNPKELKAFLNNRND